jgi:NAD(P)-dependent dehydrogenase (short-subunit alcohol dehydrogenase family)
MAAPEPSAPAPAALVTGASRGLGRGIAEALARDGLDLALHYGSNRAAAEEALAACRALSPRPQARLVLVQGDVANGADRRRIVEESVAGLGRLDAFVSNAGMAPRVRADIVDAGEGSFDELLAVNLKGPYFLAQAVARHWLSARGAARLPGGYKLVFISSASAVRASVNRGDYCISKAGLAMAAKLWAVRLAAEGVQVFEVRPGVMATDMTSAVKDRYDRLIAEGLVPQGRWGTAEDVGRTVSALLSGAIPFATGDVINVDGGLHLERL